MENTFAQGITVRRFAGFVAPSVVMMLVIGLYSVVDGIFVANYIGSDALAAVNVVYPISGFAWGISVMLAHGASAIVAIKMGEGCLEEANEKFTLISIVTAVVSVVFALVCAAFLVQLVDVLGATVRLKQYCLDYGYFIVLAAPLAFMGVIFEYFIRVDGKPGFTVLLYLSGGVVHIALDYLFIVIFHWGMAGAGMATAAGQGVMMLLGLWYFCRRTMKLRFVRPGWDGRYIVASMVNGSSEMIIESSVGITIFLFNLVALKLAGEDGVAALTIVLYVYYLLISANIGFVAGVGPLISFYFGAQEFAKVNLFLVYSRTFILASSAAVFAVAMLASPLITRIYVHPGGDVYDMAVRGIRFVAWAFVFSGANIFASGLFTAYANGKISALIAISRGLVLIMVGLAVLPLLFGFDGIWLTVIFAETTTLVLTLWLLQKYRPVYHYRW